MKIEQLIYFVEAAKQEHLGRASKILRVTASAISHSVAALENELNVELFEKRGKNIFLTDKGRNLLDRAERLIGEFKGLQESLKQQDAHRGNYRLAGTHFLAESILASAWAELSSSLPQVSAELFSLRSADVLKGVVNKELDFGVCFSPQRHPDLEFKQLLKGDLRLIVRAGHPLLKMKTAKLLSEISRFPAVLPKAFHGIEICESDPMFSKFQLKPRTKTLIDSYNVLLKIVENTDSWSLVPEIVLQRQNTLKFLNAGKGWNSFYEVSALWRKDRFFPSFFSQLIDKMTSALLKQPLT